MTEIEIRDPDPVDPSAGGAPSAGATMPSPGDGEPGPESPYKNLLVPLVVVPALIVMVLVLIFVLFGSLAGKEDSPRENLQRLLNGGMNERKQAAFNLVRQVIEYRKASADGKKPEWDIDASFLPELRRARELTGELQSPTDVPIPLVLSSVLAQLGEPEGVEQLAEMTHLAETYDPDCEYRMYAAMTLGALGAELPEAQRALAAKTLIGLLENEDAGLVLAAIAGLQNLPTAETIPALRGMLGSRVLEQRASAALSLAALSDAGGAEVLREMLTLAPYDAERALAPDKWPPQRVSESRRKALAALMQVGQPPSRGELEALGSSDSDPALREAAMGYMQANPAR